MKKNQIISQNSFTEFLLYTTPNGKVKMVSSILEHTTQYAFKSKK